MATTAMPLAAQEWHPGRDLDLVRRAAMQRSQRDTDALLSGWSATARGLVRFVAEVSQGGLSVERLIKADELLVQVYGEGPSRSKQVITAWRDTTVSPTTIRYHRDHLGIIANDFGPVIRLGDGDEVGDVPHPLSVTGLEFYRFQVGDTLVVSSGAATIRVVLVDVRPADPLLPGVVGRLALDVDRATLVRASFSFTAAAYRDATVSSISVVLENALQEGGMWLPWRQAIVIRRGSEVLSLPLTTSIRADWTIGDYRLGLHHPAALFGAPAVAGRQRPGGQAGFGAWQRVLGGKLSADEEIQGVQERAATLVKAQLLEGLPGLMLLADGGLSRVLSIDRVQGVRLGAGIRWLGPAGLVTEAAGGIATSGRVTGRLRVSWDRPGFRIGVDGGSMVTDANPWPRRSGLLNSLTTLATGDDAGDWYLSKGWGISVGLPGPTWSGAIRVGREEAAPLVSSFRAIDGTMTGNPHIESGPAWLVKLSSSRAVGASGRMLLEAQLGSGEQQWTRLLLDAAMGLPAGLRARVRAGIGSAELPAHRWLVAGGAGALTGTRAHAVGGRRLVALELSRPLPVSLPLPVSARWAADGLGSTVAPFVAFAAAGGVPEAGPWPMRVGGRSIWTVGARLDLWGPLLRLEVGWSPSADRLGVAVDAHPDWWPTL